MKEEKFIQKHISSWKEFQDLTAILDKKNTKHLSVKQIKRFLHLFNQISYQFSYASTHYPKSSILTQLNNLLGKAHTYIYAVRKSSGKDILHYYYHTFPRKLNALSRYFWISFFVFMFGVFLSLGLTLWNPDFALYFVDSRWIDTADVNRDPALRQFDYALDSAAIMTNNIRVSFNAFVLGITFGLGTIYILYKNGVLLGAITALTYLYNDPVMFWSLILPHGFIELTETFIAGTAGLMIGKALLIPGPYSRKYALIASAKEAAFLLPGMVTMLIIAGIIEGFFTPLPLSPILKLIFAAVTLLLLILYFIKGKIKSEG